MRALVRLRTPDGLSVELGPGDLIGRVGHAALLLDDPRVSEAHAMVSLRRGDLFLLSLRRLLGVGGKSVSEVLLAKGQTVELAPGLSLLVEAVSKPAQVIALRSSGMGVRPLGQVASLVRGPPLRLVGRFVPDAEACLWSNGADDWRVRIGDQATRPLAVGDGFTVCGAHFTLCAVNLDGRRGRVGDVAGTPNAPTAIVGHLDQATP